MTVESATATAHGSLSPAAPPALVDVHRLREILWPDARCRPCLRTVRRWQSQRLVPHVKIGRSVFFDPAQVRRALDASFTISPR